MFSDASEDNHSQNNTDMDQVAQDISGAPAPMGLGVNPSTFNPVLPSQPANNMASISDDDEDSAGDTPSLDNAPSAATPSNDQSAPSSAPSGLDDIKNQALAQLSPLVGKLEQSPEERYKTLMMLIQASDNHELIKEAYEAANAITDETLKAEALLGIVNEINYFSAQHSQ